MPYTRVYLPLTAQHLSALAEGGAVGPAPLSAHAVTPALGKPGLTTDQEELEHLAWLAAVEDAAQHSRDGSLRRVVAAADVDSGDVAVPAAGSPASRVEVTAELDRPRIVSFHVDEEPGATEATDLLWFDVTELAEVRALLAR
ncbi:MAG: hypothetical protein ABI249_00340 [Ornithinibacter sp.]